MRAKVGTKTADNILGTWHEAVISFDGVTIKDANSQNLHYYATGLSTGSHSLKFLPRRAVVLLCQYVVFR